jgi:hypothetical protein
MKLRNLMLAGLALCVFLLFMKAVEYPRFVQILSQSAGLLVLMVVVLVWNGYAAIRRTTARTEEDALVLHEGVRGGLAVGCAWTLVTVVPFGFPIWFLALFAGILLPWIAGAFGAIKTRRILSGMRVGFWSSAIGGMIGFAVAMAVGYVSDFVPAIHALRIPSLNGLQLAINFMFFLGTVPGTLGGLLGGWIGLALYRTGEPRLASGR